MKTHRFVASSGNRRCSAILATSVGSSITCNRTLTDCIHDLQDDEDFVTVQFSRELLEQLELKPSEPVTVMIIPPSTARDHYELIATRHECEKSA